MPHRSQPILRRPPAAGPWRSTLLIAAATVACGGHAWQPANGSEPTAPVLAEHVTITAAMERQLTPATNEAVAAAREEALASLNPLEETLATQAVGGVLAAEFRLSELREFLSQVSPETGSANATALEPFIETLRRVLPGRAQQDLDRLRQAVARLVALGRRTPETLAAARDALATFRDHLGEAHVAIDCDTDRQLRIAFDTVSSVVTDESLVVELREHLSQPNAVILLRPAFVEHLARQSFTTPVAIDRCDAGTAITGRGSVAIDLSATLQESEGTCRLLVEAVGHGQVATLAVQQRARVRAAAHPQVAGTMPLVIDPRTIHGGDPDVTATLTTRLQQLSLGGLLGRSRLVQRVASRAVQQKLAANDPVAARDIEASVGREVREQGLLYASRINTLLTWGVWDRLAAIDFRPEVRLASGREGASSQTFYARGSQLAALTPPPPLPADSSGPFDIVTQVHESAVNNLFATFGGLELDEATVRALWDVQLKLFDDAWETLPPARRPSSIRLADTAPLEVRVDEAGVRLAIRPVAGRLADTVLPSTPEEIRLHYRLDRDERGLVFRRGPGEITGDLDEHARAAWEQVIDLFFGRNLRPLPTYQTSGVAGSLTITHAALHAGWLTVAANRGEPQASPAAAEESPHTR